MRREFVVNCSWKNAVAVVEEEDEKENYESEDSELDTCADLWMIEYTLAR